MRWSFFVAGAALLLGFAAPKPYGQKAVLLGVLEDVPGHYAGQSDTRAVRLAFKRVGEEWQAFPGECPDEKCLKTISSEYPSAVTWAVTFQGRVLGRLSARTQNEFSFYSDVGLQDILGAGPIPAVGKRSEKYSGFLGTAVFRPLVVTSGAFSGDPDHWESVRLPPDLASSVRRAFRTRFPRVSNCKNPDENRAAPWIYHDRNVSITQSYSSVGHWFLVQTDLTPYRCDGPPDDAFVNQWFVITPRGEIRTLGHAMWFVDAGDYDGDGRSEVVFSMAGYDRGGYELFYDRFRRHASFEFSYH